MKTLKEWADYLPEDIGKYFLKNTSIENLRKVKAYNLRSAILNSFCWIETKQGACFWNNVFLAVDGNNRFSLDKFEMLRKSMGNKLLYYGEIKKKYIIMHL
jgi:hypothetical protein